jgi:hypothetical protein
MAKFLGRSAALRDGLRRKEEFFYTPAFHKYAKEVAGNLVWYFPYS